MAITQMDLLKDLLECMEVEDHVIRSISQQVILNLGERKAEMEGEESKSKRRAAKEEAQDKKDALANGDMSKLSKKEQRKLKKKMAKAQAKEEVEDEDKPKAAKGSHLIPKEKVEYPKELLKHKDLGPLLKLHEKGGEEGRKARKAMRKIGFKLSDSTTWKPFLKK